MFQRSHPSDLPERSKSDQELANTDKERILFASGSLKWSELAEECAEAGVAVNTWLFPSQFTDVATIGKRGMDAWCYSKLIRALLWSRHFIIENGRRYLFPPSLFT